MSLLPPITVGKLQTALHTKAKNSPDYRFYALYDKLYRRDILEWAFVRCRNNRGAPGVDGQSFADIEAYGRDQWLDELTKELRNGTYRPRPVRRVSIPDAAFGRNRRVGETNQSAYVCGLHPPYTFSNMRARRGDPAY